MLSFNNKYVATITAFYAGYINVILNTLWKLIDFESYNKYKKIKISQQVNRAKLDF